MGTGRINTDLTDLTDYSYGRMPMILLVDNSASMGDHDKIDILNNTLIDFKRFIEEDELLCKRAEICLIAFGNRITVLAEFLSIHDFNPPTLQASGPSLMGAGILKALAMLMARKSFYKRNGIEYHQPQFYFFGGSAPDDFSYMGLAGGKRWDELKAVLEDDIYHKRYMVTPCAIIPVNTPYEVSVDNGEVLMAFGTHDKVIYENNGEITSIESEGGAVNISSVPSGWEILSHDWEDIEVLSRGVQKEVRTKRESETEYLRIINTLFPPKIPLKILKTPLDKANSLSAPLAGFVDDDKIPSHIVRNDYESSSAFPKDDPVAINQSGKYNILSASVIGPLHIIKGIPCQDAYAYEVLPSGHVIITIADGLGSATMSEIGSRIAVDDAVEAIRNKTTDEMNNTTISSIARDSVAAARKALEEKAVSLQCSLRDLACTFISVVMHEDNLAVAHIGDGAVIARKGDDLIVISEPGDSEYANEVTPLTSKKWEESLNITPVYSGISGMMAFSDGLQRAALRKSEDGRIPYKAFCGPLFLFTEETSNLQDGEKEMKEFLSSKKMSDHSEDDKTLILVTLTKINRQ